MDEKKDYGNQADHQHGHPDYHVKRILVKFHFRELFFKCRNNFAKRQILIYSKSKRLRYKAPTGMAIKVLSKRSSRPPWPGIMVPESLIP